MSDTKYKVKLEEIRPGDGDVTEVWFTLKDKVQKKKEEVVVTISPELQRRLSIDNPNEVGAIAAKAMELYLLGRIPHSAFERDEHLRIRLTSYWYPGYPTTPDRMEEHDKFKLEE